MSIEFIKRVEYSVRFGGKPVGIIMHGKKGWFYKPNKGKSGRKFPTAEMCMEDVAVGFDESACVCQEFYLDPNCPIHGRN